jgi:putative spermidine/putrescine transport system ATP-binding protein
MSFLAISHLEKSFGASRVVKDFNLSVAKGEFISLLGASGCGKTTVLRMIAGFERPSAGTIHVEGQDVTGLAASRRAIGMVFQSYALFPNMTVAQNVGFGLKLAGLPRAEIADRVAQMLSLIGLPDLGARYPFQLSGGQQQRVALARALAPRPRVLLLDEPLSALDAKVRVALRSEIRQIQRELEMTTIFVTHDQEEALEMSDRVVVMNGGVAEQVGTPLDIYDRPATPFVASFVGTLNLLPARVDDAAAGRVTVAGRPVALARPLTMAQGSVVSLALRPERMRLGEASGSDIGLEATVAEVHFLGAITRLHAHLADQTVVLDVFNRAGPSLPRVGSVVSIHFDPQDVLLFDRPPVGAPVVAGAGAAR